MTDIIERLRLLVPSDPSGACIDAIKLIESQRAALQDIASGKYSGIQLLSHPPQDPAVYRARVALENENG